MYENFLEDPDNVKQGQSKGDALKNYFLRHLPDILFQDWRRKQALGEEKRHVPRHEMNIAVIQFAYNNSTLIGLLKKRGAAIKGADFIKVIKLEEEISEMKNKDLETYTRPVFAFLTFENEAGYEVGRKYESDETALLECKINIQEATEPTDIIWENRHFTDEQKKRNLYRVIIWATIYLAGSLAIITALKGGSMYVTAKYPKANCPVIEQQFDAKLEEYAHYDYEGFYDENAPMTGVLQCFC